MKLSEFDCSKGCGESESCADIIDPIEVDDSGDFLKATLEIYKKIIEEGKSSTDKEKKSLMDSIKNAKGFLDDWKTADKDREEAEPEIDSELDIVCPSIDVIDDPDFESDCKTSDDYRRQYEESIEKLAELSKKINKELEPVEKQAKIEQLRYISNHQSQHNFCLSLLEANWLD